MFALHLSPLQVSPWFALEAWFECGVIACWRNVTHSNWAFGRTTDSWRVVRIVWYVTQPTQGPWLELLERCVGLVVVGRGWESLGYSILWQGKQFLVSSHWWHWELRQDSSKERLSRIRSWRRHLGRSGKNGIEMFLLRSFQVYGRLTHHGRCYQAERTPENWKQDDARVDVRQQHASAPLQINDPNNLLACLRWSGLPCTSNIAWVWHLMLLYRLNIIILEYMFDATVFCNCLLGSSVMHK